MCAYVDVRMNACVFGAGRGVRGEEGKAGKGVLCGI